MKAYTAVVTGLAALSVAATSNAQSCESFVGQTVTPQAFNAAAAVLATIPGVKDEFETTAAFEARQQIAMSNLPEHLIISTPFDTDYASYDADAGHFTIKRYAVSNVNTDYARLFGSGGAFEGSVSYSMLGTLDVVISKTERRTGSYRAQNAFGVSTTVGEIQRTTRSIYEGSDTTRERQGLFPRTSDAVIWTVPVPATEARATRDGFRAAWVIAPKAPFYIEGEGRGFRATIDVPQDVEDTLEIIIADIQCALLTDDSGVVLAVAATH